MQSPALSISMPPIATTGVETAAHSACSPWSRVRLGRRRPDRPRADVVRHPICCTRLVDRRRREAEQQAVALRRLGALVVAAEVDAVRAQHQRGLDVVVHDEGHTVPCAEAARSAPALDHVDARHLLQPPLHDGRAPLDGNPRRLELVDEDVELHEILARPSSDAGSSAARAS
jgi:hypothetical protein